MIAIGVTLCVNCVCNRIGGQLGLITVLKLHDVGSYVEDGICIGAASGVTEVVTFTSDNTGVMQHSSPGNLDVCVEKVVPCLGCHCVIWIRVGGANVEVIIVVRLICWGQVV